MRIVLTFVLLKQCCHGFVMSEMIGAECQCEMFLKGSELSSYEPFLSSRVVEVLCMAGPWCLFF